jgi:hypothetical protein
MMKLMKILMKPKKLKTLLLTAILLISISGCYWNTPVIDLISPPRLTSEQTEILNALTNSKGAALTLKFPKTGDFLSAFVFLEKSVESPTDRVMVFNEISGAPAEQPTIWLTFLEKRDNRWECTDDFPFFATDVEKVEFSRLGDSDRENIIISYSIMNQPGKNLRVFSFAEDNRPEQVYQRDFCIFYEIGDFNNSGKNMLLSINSGGGDIAQPSAFFAEWRDGSFHTVYSVPANPAANEYVKSIKGALTRKNNDDITEIPILFLEYSRTDAIFGTGIILWNRVDNEEGGGERVRPHNIIYQRNQSIRSEFWALLDKRPNLFTAHAYARDINGNGEFNVAGNRLFPGYSHDDVNASERARAAIWYEITDDNRLEKLHYTYLSVNNDYVFIFPEEWEENVTVTISLDDNEVTFWEYDHSEYESIYDVENHMLSIIAVPKGEALERSDREEYTLFNSDKNEHFDYYVKITNRAIRQRALRSALRFL